MACWTLAASDFAVLYVSVHGVIAYATGCTTLWCSGNPPFIYEENIMTKARTGGGWLLINSSFTILPTDAILSIHPTPMRRVESLQMRRCVPTKNQRLLHTGVGRAKAQYQKKFHAPH
ncbi:hypothetical protein F4860DRAFT_498049 [Xylaria cubensis]|nr:hypothetical protein F4860DRAFT_498049 [Xylaria cubensis]